MPTPSDLVLCYEEVVHVQLSSRHPEGLGQRREHLTVQPGGELTNERTQHKPR